MIVISYDWFDVLNLGSTYLNGPIIVSTSKDQKKKISDWSRVLGYYTVSSTSNYYQTDPDTFFFISRKNQF